MTATLPNEVVEEKSAAAAADALTFRQLDPAAEPGSVAPFAEMTFPSLRPLLAGQEPGATPVAVGAWLGAEPVGLALGRILDGPKPMPRLMSLFITDAQRNRGFGAALLARFEQEMAARGCAEVDTVFMTPRAGAAEFAAVLARRGWIKPELRMQVLRATAASISQAPWYRWPLTKGLTVVPWREITAAERADLQAWQAEEKWIPRDLLPWESEVGADMHVSLGARYNGRVVGWMISHKISADMVRATTCWIYPKLPPRMHAILFTNLIKLTTTRAIEPECGAVTCTWTVPVQFPAYQTTSEKWVAPYCVYRGETLQSAKALGDAGSVGAAAAAAEGRGA